MLASLMPWIADALVVLGLLIFTVSLWGVLKMPDLFTSLHAASKGAALGLAPIIIAAGLDDRTILLRGLLVLVFLLLTTPVGSHAIARAYWIRHEKGAEPRGAGNGTNDETPHRAAGGGSARSYVARGAPPLE